MGRVVDHTNAIHLQSFKDTLLERMLARLDNIFDILDSTCPGKRSYLRGGAVLNFTRLGNAAKGGRRRKQLNHDFVLLQYQVCCSVCATAYFVAVLLITPTTEQAKSFQKSDIDVA